MTPALARELANLFEVEALAEVNTWFRTNANEAEHDAEADRLSEIASFWNAEAERLERRTGT